MSGRYALAYPSEALVAEQVGVVAKFRREPVFVAQQQVSDVVGQRNRLGWRGLTRAQVRFQHLKGCLADQARGVVDMVERAGKEGDRLTSDPDRVRRSPGVDQITDRGSRLSDVVGVVGGLAVFDVATVRQHDQIPDRTAHGHGVSVHGRRAQLEAPAQRAVLTQQR